MKIPEANDEWRETSADQVVSLTVIDLVDLHQC